MPMGAASFAEGMRWAAEVFHTLEGVLKRGVTRPRRGRGRVRADPWRNEAALEVIIEAIAEAGYEAGQGRGDRARSGVERAVRQEERPLQLPIGRRDR